MVYFPFYLAVVQTKTITVDIAIAMEQAVHGMGMH